MSLTKLYFSNERDETVLLKYNSYFMRILNSRLSSDLIDDNGI